MNLLGPWLVPLFGVGTVLLVGGLLTKELASDRSVKGLGRGAATIFKGCMDVRIIILVALLSPTRDG